MSDDSSETDKSTSPGKLATRIESTDYVVLCTACKVLSEPGPSGVVVGERQRGQTLGTTLRTTGTTSNDGWVRLNEVIPTSPTGVGWVLIDGTLLGLGVQLEKKAFERPRMLKHYLAEERVEVCSGVKGAVVGHRAVGRLLRTDLELTGWVRLTEDLFRDAGDGSEPDIVEGWVCLASNKLQRWWPAEAPKGAPPESLPGKFAWHWVIARGGVAVREKPWGAVITKREFGELLRGDLVQEGWLRLEEDFVKASDGGIRGKGGEPPDSVGAEDEVGRTVLAEDVPNNVGGELMRGWVLIDGRELGMLSAQLQPRSEYGERRVPKPAITQAGGGRVFISWELSEEVADNLASKFRRRRAQAEADRGEDWSIAAVAASVGVPEETAETLVRCGVPDLHELIRVTARGDVNEELKNVGVGRVGARSKFAKLLQPYFDAQRAKEAANAEYKRGKYEEAVEVYSRALDAMSCRSATIALHLYNNRSAALQQLGKHTEALADCLFVLRYDAANSKALARAERARACGAKTAAEMADAEAAKAEAVALAEAAAEASREDAEVETAAAVAAVAAVAAAAAAEDLEDGADARETVESALAGAAETIALAGSEGVAEDGTLACAAAACAVDVSAGDVPAGDVVSSVEGRGGGAG